MIIKCKTCKKEKEVLWPDCWAYKKYIGHGMAWFCSWGCMRAQEKKQGKEAEEKMNNQMDMARKMVEAIEKGEDALEFLRRNGYTNPMKAYGNLRNKCREKDPELAARIPDRRFEKKPEPKVELVYDEEIAEEYRREQAQKKAAQEAKVTDEELARIEEEIMNLPPVKAQLPEPDEGEMWHVTAIRNKEWGVFYFDEKFRTIDWRHPSGEEVSLTVADWKRLPELIPQILRVLGLEV